MSDFLQWSRWFERGLDVPGNKTHAVAMMGWIAAHASSDWTGFAFDNVVWDSLEDDVGLSASEAQQAIVDLIAAGLVAEVSRESDDQLVARAVL